MSLYDRVAKRKADRQGANRKVLDSITSTERGVMASRDQSHWARLNDQGLVMTEAAQSEFDTAWETAGANIQTAKDAIAKAKAKFEAEKGTVDSKWSEYSKGFVTVRVVNGSNVEQEYRIPKEIADEFFTKTFNQGDGSFVANWFGDDKNPQAYLNVDVVPQGIDDAYGKELHEAMAGTVNQVHDTFYEKVGANMKAAEQEFNKTIADYDAAVAASEKFNKDMVGEHKQRQTEQAEERTKTSMGLFGDRGGVGEYKQDQPKGVLG